MTRKSTKVVLGRNAFCQNALLVASPGRNERACRKQLAMAAASYKPTDHSRARLSSADTVRQEQERMGHDACMYDVPVFLCIQFGVLRHFFSLFH